MNNTVTESSPILGLSNAFKRFIGYQDAGRHVTFNCAGKSIGYAYNPLDGRTGIKIGDEFAFQSWCSILSIKHVCKFEYQGDLYAIERLYSSENLVTSMCVLTLSVNGDIVQTINEAAVNDRPWYIDMLSIARPIVTGLVLGYGVVLALKLVVG